LKFRKIIFNEFFFCLFRENGDTSNKPALLKQLVEELEVNLAKSLVTFLSLSDSLPHPVPQAPYR
jgi:hypothetical protein